jgi:hypothetical protein
MSIAGRSLVRFVAGVVAGRSLICLGVYVSVVGLDVIVIIGGHIGIDVGKHICIGISIDICIKKSKSAWASVSKTSPTAELASLT